MNMNNECLTKEGFLKYFKKLSKVQKTLFLQKAKQLQKITSVQTGVDNNCLAVFTKLFDAYQAYSTSMRNQINNAMQSNIDICTV